jgi:hypothetical protein
MRSCLRVSVLRRTGGDTSAVHGDPVWGGWRPTRRSISVAGLPVTVGSEPRSDAIGIRRTRLARFIRRLEVNTPPPDERAPMTVARGHPRGRIICCPAEGHRPRRRHQLASDRPEREE